MVELIKYDAARRALSEARKVDEVKRIRDKATALEVYSRQAKDREMEIWSAEIRLRAERRAGELLKEMKEQGERHRGSGDQKSESKLTTPILADLGITRDESSKWQQLANITEEEFEAKIQEATSAKELGISGFLKTAFSSNSVEWITPPDIIARARTVMREIDLDPCADWGNSVSAKQYFTAQDDGLSKRWIGRVFMNPPYGDTIGQWVEKLLAELIDPTDPGVTQAIALVPARTDTAWFQHFFSHYNAPVCFISGRLKFSGHENSAPFPSAIIYFGENQHSFAEQFGPIGTIYMPALEWLLDGEDQHEPELGEFVSR
jgi:hypothetical protein